MFETRNFHLASFLFAKRHTLLDLEKSKSGKTTFQFKESAELLDDLDFYRIAPENDKTVLIDARLLQQATKYLKERLYD